MKAILIPVLCVMYEWFLIRKPIRDSYALMEQQHQENRKKLIKMLDKHK
jgi:hypothetical protein